jgi:hypothetical protein
MPHLDTPPRPSSLRCTTTAVDVWGRLADRSTLRTLEWSATTSLGTVVIHKALVLTPDHRGRPMITQQGHLRLHASIRHLMCLTAGTRLLLAASPDRNLLICYPPAALDAMILAYHSRQSEDCGEPG